MHARIVVVEGIIGAGKSTLSRQLAELFRVPMLSEPVETNPYLAAFYQDPEKWAFEMQTFMLGRRHAQQQEAAWRCLNGEKAVFLDRSLPGDRVFARLHTEAGNISMLGWENYDYLFHLMTTSMLPPRLMIYLDVDPEVALERVKRRGRAAELESHSLFENGKVAFSESPCCHTNAIWRDDNFYCTICKSGMSDIFRRSESGHVEAGSEPLTVDLSYLQRLRMGYQHLLGEIDSGSHHWSRGMEVVRVDWNGDTTEAYNRIVAMLEEKLGLKQSG